MNTTQGNITAGLVISAQNIWSGELAAWTGIEVPLVLSRHAVFTLEGPEPYTRRLPVLLGIVALSAAYIGFFRAPLSRWAKVALSLAGLVLVFNQFWPNIIGVAVVLSVLGWNAFGARRSA